MFQFITKHKKLNLIFPPLFLILLLQSCEEILQIKIPDNGPMITVNCILNYSKEIQMEIISSQPYPPLIDSTLTIKDAKVKLYDDDVYIEDLVYQESLQRQEETGFYLSKIRNYHSVSGFTPELSHTYIINVTAPGFPDVTSKTFIPKPVPVISVDTNTVFTMSAGHQYKTIECTIRFKDTPGDRNCYKLTITRHGLYYSCPSMDWSKCNTSEIIYTIPFICHDLNAVSYRMPAGSPGSFVPGLEEEEIMQRSIFISDDSFDGKTYELKVLIPLNLSDMAYPPVRGEKFTLRKINFELSSINEEYYKYARSNYVQVYKKNDMFSEPCTVYSNIYNGVGIFSGSSVSIDSSIVMPVYYSPPMY